MKKIAICLMFFLSSFMAHAETEYYAAGFNECVNAGMCAPNNEAAVPIKACIDLANQSKADFPLDFNKSIAIVKLFNGGLLDKAWDGDSFSLVSLALKSPQFGDIEFECATSHHHVIVDIFEPLFKTPTNILLRKNALQLNEYTRSKIEK